MQKICQNKITSGLIVTFLLVLFSFGDVSAFTANQAATIVLGQSDLTTSIFGATASTLQGPQATAFDSTGNLWVADSNNDRVLMYPQASLGTSGSAATVVLGWQDFETPSSGVDASSLHRPIGLAFDSTGNLWVADQADHRVLMYPKASLGTSGSAATVVLGQPDFRTYDLGTTATTLHFPMGLAFDSTGNLWVADQANNRVLMYPKASLGTSGSAATVVLGKPDFTTTVLDQQPIPDNVSGNKALNSPQGLAFDSTGNLWVADLANNRVLMYPKASLGTSGSAATIVVGWPDFATLSLGTTTTTLFGPTGIGFDSADNLWVADELNNRILMYPQASLGKSGSAATVVLGQPDFTTGTFDTTKPLGITSANTLHLPMGLAFDSTGNLWVADTANSRVVEFNDKSTSTQTVSSSVSESAIPSWIHNNAKWWSEGSIGDGDFIKGIQYLVQQEIIKVPQTQQGTAQSEVIPSWIKNNAGWWASGQISDGEFVKGIQFLISAGIIKI